MTGGSTCGPATGGPGRSSPTCPWPARSRTTCARSATPAPAAIRREHVEAHLADLGDRSSAANTAKHYRSLQQLFRWLVDDGELAESPMARMRPPAVPEQPVPVLSDDELRRLLAACKGNTFENRRDEAIIRLFVDTGMRAGELIGLTVADIDQEPSAAYVMGKGGRGRACPYGPKPAEALRRYLRARARHPRARLRALWLGKKGPLTDSGLRQMLERRCDDAGLPHVHPHQLRHTFAHRWLAAGEAGDGPDAGGRVEVPSDGRPLRRVVGRHPGPGGASPARVGRHAVEDPL